MSYWEYDSYFNNLDVVIVGAGIIGLSTAIELQKHSTRLKILVLERGLMPDGASTKNAGFACFGSTGELLDDINNYSTDIVISLVKRRWEGLQLLRKNLGDEAIGFEKNGGYEIFTETKEYEKCVDSLEKINSIISEIFKDKAVFEICDEVIKPFGFSGVSHLIYNKYEGQLNTGKMMRALHQKAVSMGVLILNNSVVNKIESANNKNVLVLSNGIEIYCNKILVTINGFAKNLLPELEVQPARSQVLVTSPIKNLSFKGSFHYDKGYYYFRNIGNRILLGGGRNLDFKNEFTDQSGVTEKIQNRLEEMLKTNIIPNQQYTIEHRWSGIMGVGSDKSSIIKMVKPNIFCAVRMGGMGVAIGSLVAKETSELILNS